MKEVMENEGVEKGVITRIYVKNFVTYDEVTVRPGRNLNLIIGPNGTGKSTIVSAIVLGLGGSTKVIGRAEQIGHFVKSGHTNAIIEIDLQNDRNKYVTVKRCFDTKNQSTWSVNNKTVNAKQICDLMDSFNIQINNLCQFLPQDKVQEFSKMTAPQLLKETQRSVGDPKLLKYHDKLIQLREKQAELEKELEGKTKLLAKDKLTYDSLKDSVGHINEQKQIKKKLVSLKQKKAWIQYQNRREEFAEAKKGRDAALAKKKKAEKNVEPVNQELEKIKATIQTLEKTAKQHLSETNAKKSRLSKLSDDVENYERSINEVESQCEEEIRTEQERDERINQLREDKNKMENDVSQLLNDIGQLDDIVQNLSTINVEISDHRKTLSDKKNYETYYKDQINHIERKIRADEQNLQEVYDIENKRLDTLRQLSRDAYQGVLWLRENKHLFSQKIHEPMLLNINLKDPSYSKFFENLISQRDLTAFVCEDKNDMNMLLKYLRTQQKLKINAVHSDPNKEVNDAPRVPLENIKQFGFHHYLVSLIEAPQTVMNYLITMYKLNEIPIGSDQVASQLDRIPDSIIRFFSNSNFYSISRSKYTGEKSTRQAGLSSRNILAITIDHSKIQRIQEEINSSKEKVSALAVELKKCQEEVVAVNRKIESLKGNRNKLQTNKSKIDNIYVRMKLIDESINKEQKNRKKIDDIRLEFKKKIQNIIKQQLNCYKSYTNMQDECNKSSIIDEEIKLQIKLKKNEHAIAENNAHDLRAELNEAERNYRALDNELTPLKTETKNLYDTAKELTEGLCYDDPEFSRYKAIFAKLPASIEEIISEIQRTQAKIFSLKTDQSETARILRQFNDVKKNIDTLEGVIKEKDAELTKVTEEISRTKNEWYPSLSALVDKINNNFSNYFSKMKCAGEVSLCHGDNPMNFKEYGLQIRVKFRDADELQVLTRNHQSGGERAVTTAVYMISLQELTRVPFRCVDEINQGMDATNERRVFELIVNITSKSNSSQYFLLTPKLLPNLKYNETITVLTVLNGKHMIPCSKFDINNDCEKIVNTIINRRNGV
ncbi:structural maintenance of chromosomes protein 5 [Copidosoma floridanum]|uniref:structural maintenance of chromosomes protein 5 n=1 Tax=Copidosoma floridanum TaxID=29053 RepID=UPI0006C987C4|nr:structural maintenance of chromosomes protein 5 [Copidosoma floridanum]